MGVVKRYEDLQFTDRFMFGKVMQHEEICRCILETILGVRISKIEYVEIEKTLESDVRARGVRLDDISEEQKLERKVLQRGVSKVSCVI